jgi:cyclophilin family peptidyl-prolyl cis-trans isomerase
MKSRSLATLGTTINSLGMTSGRCLFLLVSLAASGRAQDVGPRDSALVRRILLAEDRRDASSAALSAGAESANARLRNLTRRAAARIADPRFTARDSFPRPFGPPAYSDPAWRLRYRALNKTNCAALRGALADSVWPVRLHAADLVDTECASDTAIVAVLRGWARAVPVSVARTRGGVSWHPAAHAIVALARFAPASARALLPPIAGSRIPFLRMYAARASGVLNDTMGLRAFARDENDNVKEIAIDLLTKVAGHSADDLYLSALSARGYQAVRAAALALAGSPRRSEGLAGALTAARRLRADSSETSRDTRLAVLERINEFGTPAQASAIGDLANDFDCVVAQKAADIAVRFNTNGRLTSAHCTPLPVRLPPDAVALALGREGVLRVVMADASGGGSFVVRLRGDVAPIMSARILALARSRYYDGLTWQRVEPDFVIQGGSPGGNEYIGNKRYIRDELGTVPHVRGTVGMSTRGHDTGDAQWFVNLRDNLRLDRDYSVFGEVVEGIDVVDDILEGDTIARIEVVR